MTTYESTVELLKRLPEEDLLAINGLVRRLVSRIPSESPDHMISEKQFFDRLATARQHAEQGKVRSDTSVIEDARSRYGL